MKNFFDTTGIKIVFAAIWLIVIIIAITIFGPMIKNKDARLYNDGICTKCGGTLEFSGATLSTHSMEHYFYTCTGCGSTIRLLTLR